MDPILNPYAPGAGAPPPELAGRDELQVLDAKQLAALIRALHVSAQDLLPITMIAAGLPQILAKMGEAKTYAERLFEFSQIGYHSPVISLFAFR